MDSTVIKRISEQCQKGEFERALERLKNVHQNLTCNYAIKLIINCCSVCASNVDKPEKIEDVFLYDLLKLIIPYIKVPNEAQLLSYAQAIFHILKIYIEKHKCNIIISMEDILLPTFLPMELPKKVGETYHRTAIILYNFIIKCSSATYELSENVWMKISWMVSRMCSYSEPLILINFSYNCLLIAKDLNVSNNLSGGYYLEVFKLMIRNKEVSLQSDDYFEAILKFTVIILNSFLQNNEFKECEDFLMQISKLTGVFKQKYVYLHCLLRFPLLLLPMNNNVGNELEQCKNILLTLTTIWKSSKIFRQLGNNIHLLLHSVMKYYKSENCKPVFIDFKVEVCEFLYEFAHLECQISALCPCKCSTDKSIYRSFVYGQDIINWITIFVSHNIDILLSSHKKVAVLLAKFFENIVLLKKHKCEKWKEGWDTIALAVYNIGVTLYRQKNQAALEYFYLIIKYYLKLDGKSGTFTLKLSMLASSFTAIVNLHTTDFKKAMAFSALAILLCPNQRETFMYNWITVKHSQSEKEDSGSRNILKTTLVAAFTIFKVELACVVKSDFLLNSDDKVNLLIYELELYKKRWRSKVPMMAAFKELCAIADLDTKVKTAVNVFSDDQISVHEDVCKNIQNIFQEYEKAKLGDEDPLTNISLAILNFLNYKFLLKKTIRKNADDMERTMSVMASKEVARDAATRELNEDCDIVSSYESLWLKKFLGTMKFLDTSLSLFSTAISDIHDKLEGVEITNIYNILMKISCEYNLHLHRVRSLQALQLALKIAQNINNAKDIIKTVSLLIEKSDIKKTYIKYLTLLADKQMEKLDPTDVDDLKTMLTYFISKSRVHLYTDNKESLRLFNLASKMLDEQENKEEFNLINSQLMLLNSKFLMMPCEWRLWDHKKSNAFVQMYAANKIIYYEYNNNKLDSAYGITLLLDTIEDLIRSYYLMRCPREVRCHCKETVILTQKLVLPLRSARFLKYLAHADLRNNSYDDCQVKLNGMTDILCLTKNYSPIKDTTKKSSITKLESEMDGITNDLREMVMDLPAAYKSQLSPSSPKFVIEPFKLPLFFKHEESCECFFCICIEYQELVLEKTRLDALINNKRDNRVVARDFFLGVLNIYKNYCDRYENYLETNANFISYDLVPDYKEEFVMVYANFLFDYSTFLMRSGDKHGAFKINTEVINLLLPRKIQYVYLYNEVLVQRLGYLTESLVGDQAKGESKIDNFCTDDGQMVEEPPKTPITKQNKVVFTISCSPNLSPPKRVVKKCFTSCKLSPTESYENLKTKNSPEKHKSPKTPILKPRIPIENKVTRSNLNVASSKIQIYAETTKKTKRKADEPDKSEMSVVPALKIESGLKTRTKLLTEKLRQSSKEDGSATSRSNTENGAPSNPQNGTRAHLVRKNLLNEISGSHSNKNQLTDGVRRSQRSRK